MYIWCIKIYKRKVHDIKFCNVLHMLLLQCSSWLFAFVWAHGIKNAYPYELKMLYLSPLPNSSTIQCHVHPTNCLKKRKRTALDVRLERHTKYQWDDEIKRNWRSNISYCEPDETTERCDAQHDSSKPAGQPQIKPSFFEACCTGRTFYIHMLILVYTQ